MTKTTGEHHCVYIPTYHKKTNAPTPSMQQGDSMTQGPIGGLVNPYNPEAMPYLVGNEVNLELPDQPLLSEAVKLRLLKEKEIDEEI